jgi:hypothetical protein
MQVPAGTAEDVIVQNLLALRDQSYARSRPISASPTQIGSQEQSKFLGLFRLKAGALQVATIVGGRKVWNYIPNVGASAPDQEQI